MDEKRKQTINRSSLRRYIDEQDRNMNSNSQQLIPISIDHLSSISTVSPKRRRSSTINNQPESISNNQHLLYTQNILPITTTTTPRKRAIQDDYFIEEHNQYTNKRARYEQSNSTELENQPPRATIKRRSLFLYHQDQDWNNLQIQNEIPSSFNQFLPSSSTSHRTYCTPNHEYQSNHFSPCDLHNEHLNNQHLYMFGNDTLRTSAQKSTIPKSSMNIIKDNVRLLSPQSNGISPPLRTTNFVLDSKQQAMSATIMRSGNISPAHSDSSSESTSTCSSDEQQYHQNFSSYHYQPSRSFRERENYEQLLDLAQKLSDPNRFNQVDIEQFFSYRYKTKSPIENVSSKQTACVICMSHFKNGQHIRVLPCQHEYHSKCIAQWFTMNSSCPICRRDNFLSTC